MRWFLDFHRHIRRNWGDTHFKIGDEVIRALRAETTKATDRQRLEWESNATVANNKLFLLVEIFNWKWGAGERERSFFMHVNWKVYWNYPWASFPFFRHGWCARGHATECGWNFEFMRLKICAHFFLTLFLECVLKWKSFVAKVFAALSLFLFSLCYHVHYSWLVWQRAGEQRYLAKNEI